MILNSTVPYLPIIEGKYKAMPGKMAMRTVTASMAIRKGMDPRKIVDMGTSLTTPARV